MKRMLPAIFLIVTISISITMGCFGQASIQGKVKDAEQNMAFATVTLLDTDSNLVRSVLTDRSGDFIFGDVVPGHYFITTSVTGFVQFYSSPIPVEQKDIILPHIVLEKKTEHLNEVIVRAKKPLYEQKIDRIVVNVQSSITSSGGTVLEVLQKSPGIVVNRQNNNISMDGKSGVRVMINDKLMQLPLDVVVQMLDGMSASNVEKIELVNAPPAKYDAEGNAGIIRIVMKGNTDIGTNGSIALTAGYKAEETLGASFNVNHRSRSFACFLDYSILRNHNQHELKFERQSINNGFVQTVTDNSHRGNLTIQQNLNAGIEWKLTSNTLLSLSLTGYRRDWSLSALNRDKSIVTQDSIITTNMRIDEVNVWQSGTAGIALQTKINARSGININLDYLYYNNNNPSSYNDTTFFNPGGSNEVSRIDLKKTTPITFLVATADYQLQLSSSLLMEAGMKGVTSDLDNNVLTRRYENNAWKIDDAFTSYSTLHEQSGAAYLSGKWQAGKSWQINAGLRYEYTYTSISTPRQHNLISRKNGYLFPGLSLRKEIGKAKDIQFSYTRRITRPTYNDIAPFVFFWGPNSFSAGNTSLMPAISDAVKGGYHSGKWIVSLQFSHTKNEITAWQPEIDGSNNLTYRSQNLKWLNTMGLTNSFSFGIARWWELQTNATLLYQVAQTTHLQYALQFRNWGLNVDIINSIRLPRDFSIEIAGIFQSKTRSGIAEYLPMGSLNAGVQKKLGTIGTLRLAMDDIFNTNNWRIKTYMPERNLNTYFDYNFHNRFIRLTYTRNFGNNKLKAVKLQSGSEEERRRINN